MDAPKCKICGEKHYGLCPSFQAKAKPSAGTRPSDAGKSDLDRNPSQNSRSLGSTKSTVPEPIPSQPRNGSSAESDGASGAGDPGLKFDKVAYQREYMRKRRAKIKASKLA